MSYVFNAIGWAMVINGYLILTTKKICSDLPQISPKTLEASLRALKSMGLIEVNLTAVPKWNGVKVRGIRITAKGMTYNNSLYKPSEQAIIKKQQQEIEELKRKIEEIAFPSQKDLEEVKPPKEEKPKEIEKTQPPKEEKPKEVEETKPSKEETKPPKKDIEESKLPKEEENEYSQHTFNEFVEAVKKAFGTNSIPICNQVKGWYKETAFYINSYNKLAVITPQGDYIQVQDPRDINKFWTWLYNNKDKIGVVYDFDKPLDVEELNYRYKGMKIKINDIEVIVEELITAFGGVKIKVKLDNNKSMILSNNKKGELIYSYKECEEILLNFRY